MKIFYNFSISPLLENPIKNDDFYLFIACIIFITILLSFYFISTKDPKTKGKK